MAKKKESTRYFLSVMGIPFEVQLKDKVIVDGEKEECAGVTYGAYRRIEISREECKTEELMNSTLIHEYCHAVLYVTGQSETLSEEQEEGIVVAMEHAFSQQFTLTLEEMEEDE